MAKGWSNLVEWWRRLLVWFFSIFTKSEEKRAHPPPPLKPKRIRRKEEKRERKLQRKAKKREEALQAPPEQRLLEEQAKVIEEVADKAELEESQRCKPDEDTLTNLSHPLHSSDSLSCKEFCEPSKDEATEDEDEENSCKSFHLTPSSVCSKVEPSKDETSEDVEENSYKSFHQNPSSVCSKTSKGQRIRQKEERREKKQTEKVGKKRTGSCD